MAISSITSTTSPPSGTKVTDWAIKIDISLLLQIGSSGEEQAILCMCRTRNCKISFPRWSVKGRATCEETRESGAIDRNGTFKNWRAPIQSQFLGQNGTNNSQCIFKNGLDKGLYATSKIML